MPKKIKYSLACVETILEITDYIIFHYKAPLTGLRFSEKLQQYIEDIAKHPELYPHNQHESLRKYGSENMRISNFQKKWVILFEVEDNFVIIQKIIHAGKIID